MLQSIDTVEVSGTTTINDLLAQLVVAISAQVTKDVTSNILSTLSTLTGASQVEHALKPRRRQPRQEGIRVVAVDAQAKVATPAPANTPKGKRQLSPEAKRKISDSQKARWARLKSTSEQVTTPPLPSDDDTEVDSPQLTRELVEAQETEVLPPEVLPVTVASVESLPVATREGYTGDVFYVQPDGHYVGMDGFVVPKNFEEFLIRFPNYITGWAKKRLFGKASVEDIEDWTQDLLAHIGFLPPGSKRRELGMVDVVQTFDPFQQYGASERRFRYYINFCLTNKFNTAHGKKVKNPICRVGNLSLSNVDDSMQEMYSNGEATEEYIYANSKYMVTASNRVEKNSQDKVFVEKFIEYVTIHDPQVVGVLKAIHISGSTGDILQDFCMTCNRMATTVELGDGTHIDHTLGLNAQEFQRAKNRLKQLATCFSNNTEPPKARKAYKRREKAAVA
jgi:hypothetical protein